MRSLCRRLQVEQDESALMSPVSFLIYSIKTGQNRGQEPQVKNGCRIILWVILSLNTEIYSNLCSRDRKRCSYSSLSCDMGLDEGWCPSELHWSSTFSSLFVLTQSWVFGCCPPELKSCLSENLSDITDLQPMVKREGTALPRFQLMSLDHCYHASIEWVVILYKQQTCRKSFYTSVKSQIFMPLMGWKLNAGIFFTCLFPPNVGRFSTHHPSHMSPASTRPSSTRHLAR